MIFFIIYYLYKYISKNVDVNYEELLEPITQLQHVYNSNDTIKVFKNKNAKVGHNLKNNILDMYFIGTDDLVDLCQDINIIQSDYTFNDINYGKVHSGFLNYYRTINTDIINFIKENKDTVKAINLYGHSLGSVCVFLAFELKQLKLIEDIKVVTFGSPRLGNHDFVRNIDKVVNNNIRIILQNDFVNKLPGKIINYFHCGLEKKITNKGFLTHSLSYYYSAIELNAKKP